MNGRLPDSIRDKLLPLPESGYGYQVVTVYLDDGQRIPNVFAAGGDTVVKVGSHLGPTFDTNRVVDVDLQRIW
jgi:hypothetical protein